MGQGVGWCGNVSSRISKFCRHESGQFVEERADEEGNNDQRPTRQNHHASNEQGDTRERESASRFELYLNYEA